MSRFNAIQTRLAAIEEEQAVAILFACESGSRAWDFASQDSDYDVRFIYVHPTDWYSSIDLERRRDVIECPIENDLDICGWDIRKALGLLRKSNPPLMEWLGSPIIYRESNAFRERMRDLATTYFSPRACAHHYLNMARSNHHAYVKGTHSSVKQVIYVLRPLLAVDWLSSRRSCIPTEFPELVATLIDDAGLRKAIDDLLLIKRHGQEQDTPPDVSLLDEFMSHELEHLDKELGLDSGSAATASAANAFFRQVLREME